MSSSPVSVNYRPFTYFVTLTSVSPQDLPPPALLGELQFIGPESGCFVLLLGDDETSCSDLLPRFSFNMLTFSSLPPCSSSTAAAAQSSSAAATSSTAAATRASSSAAAGTTAASSAAAAATTAASSSGAATSVRGYAAVAAGVVGIAAAALF